MMHEDKMSTNDQAKLMAIAFALAAYACRGDGDTVSPNFDFGADFRIRQEIMGNLPGLPGDAYSQTPAVRAKSRNQIRMRPRVWMSMETGPFSLYARLTDEFRHYPTLNTSRHSQPYYFPDEVFLDNLYFEGRGLEWDALAAVGVSRFDFRIGRQDLFEGGHSAFGLDRIIAEGTPTDGSRGFYSDMVRARLHFGEERYLDAFALYDSGRSDIRWGTSGSRGRSLNCINMSDSNDLDEWGGGLIYSQTAFGGALPFKAYSIFKRTEAHTTEKPEPRVRPAKEITTLGIWAEPRFCDDWSLEIEGAKQFGRIADGNRQAGGWMMHAELKYHAAAPFGWKSVLSSAVTYYSGDKRRTGDGNNDTSWDPMWARYTQDSEMLVYGSLYENCWWSNMIYAKVKVTMSFGPRHGLYLYSGPMFAAERDGLGHADGGGSRYKGLLTAARYDFPILLAPSEASGADRLEIVSHVVGELFNPGDYYESGKPAFFFRWQVEVKF